MEKALDEALEESPELLQQVDGINDSDVERPGRVEVVTGEKAEGETDGSGGWILGGRRTNDPRQIQRKARKEVETRWPNRAKSKLMVDKLLQRLEEKKKSGHLEKFKEYLDNEEKAWVESNKRRSRKL